ncbi:MAG: GrpB family protein [Polaromonas sp.]|nr:GrpB family protein [Polaromonas sp.]
MTDAESLHAAIHEEVALRPYDASWPARFAAEQARLLALLPGRFLAVEHMGSTAVPGLVAKPVIDILAAVESMEQARALTAPLCEAGYTTSAEFNATLSDRQWFMRWADGHRTHHLHVVVHGSKVWGERLRFRDELRASPDLAAAYASLKAELAAAHTTDREAYTEAKADFVRATLDRL